MVLHLHFPNGSIAREACEVYTFLKMRHNCTAMRPIMEVTESLVVTIDQL